MKNKIFISKMSRGIANNFTGGVFSISIFLMFTPISHAVSYNYDEFHRLEYIEKRNGTIIEFDYDDLGNRIAKTVSIASVVSGDVDGNGTMDIADAILCLQVATGMEFESDNIDKAADINSDQKIGIEETIYVLRKVSGLD